jgi:hypothetical protein
MRNSAKGRLSGLASLARAPARNDRRLRLVRRRRQTGRGSSGRAFAHASSTRQRPMSLTCLLNTELPPCLPIVAFARWGPGRHHAGTAARSVHRVQSERAQCVLTCEEYKRYLGVDLRSGKCRARYSAQDALASDIRSILVAAALRIRSGPGGPHRRRAKFEFRRRPIWEPCVEAVLARLRQGEDSLAGCYNLRAEDGGDLASGGGRHDRRTA